jgi:hypothetical protein
MHVQSGFYFFWHFNCYSLSEELSHRGKRNLQSRGFGLEMHSGKTETGIISQEVTDNMQTDTSSSKLSEKTSKIIDKLMVASGVIALVWILAFLLVGIIEK